jgi:predicted nuclease of predicted toxin-antitoxin system
MRFLVDECAGPVVTEWLRQQGHDVVSIYGQARGSQDDAIIQMAADEATVLIANDKDFGAKVFRDRRSHHGVVLLRLNDERSACKSQVLSHLLDLYAARLAGSFVVVSEHRVKFGRAR